MNRRQAKKVIARLWFRQMKNKKGRAWIESHKGLIQRARRKLTRWQDKHLEKPITCVFHGCLCCGPVSSMLHSESIIGVGFGWASLLKDGVAVWTQMNLDAMITAGDAEEIARKDPEHDWRIVMEGALRGSTHQRQGDMQWVLIGKTMGFA